MIKLKNDEEIKRIRESCKMLADVYSEIKEIVKEGITTSEIDKFTYDRIKIKGGIPAFLDYSGYPASICISINEEIIHGIPGKRKIKNGDLVSLDLGINLNGYFSDSAITLPIGTISDEAEKLIKVTENSLYSGIAACKCGGRIKDISSAVYNIAKSEGLRCGSGVLRPRCWI